ncbi:hypothetical protein AHF37_10926 [Paragonimus kellicotti]|nr:hypothetical protein AHF37_10926 [Paragonimus kellicotti]
MDKLSVVWRFIDSAVIGYRPNSVTRTLCSIEKPKVVEHSTDLPPELWYLDELVCEQLLNERTLKIADDTESEEDEYGYWGEKEEEEDDNDDEDGGGVDDGDYVGSIKHGNQDNITNNVDDGDCEEAKDSDGHYEYDDRNNDDVDCISDDVKDEDNGTTDDEDAGDVNKDDGIDDLEGFDDGNDRKDEDDDE